MYHTRTVKKTIPLEFLLKKKTKKQWSTLSVKRMNIALGLGVMALVTIQALLVNYLNTIDLRLQEVQQREETIKNEIGELNAVMLEAESLEGVQDKARELGMVSETNVLYLTTEDQAVAKN